jgi:hypothetical protein
MNKAITQGLVFTPPPFSAGLTHWSREDSLPSQGSYHGQPNAAFVPSDADFAGCLELQKTQATQKLRCFQQIPIQPGLYLRVTAKVKAMSGALPAVRIAAFAATAGGANVGSAVQVGPSTQLTTYGSVVTVQAIIGSGNRPGNNMVWGATPAYGHFGLDLTGPNGGVVRIDDIQIEDITSVFLAEMFDFVDVRDFGAVGNGVTDDRAAFVAADAAAVGRTVVVSPGTYFMGSNMTFNNHVQFQGTLTMAVSTRLACLQNYDLNTYVAAFGTELEGFRRALQALFFFTDHVILDLNGRKIELTAPIDLAALSGLTVFEQRRLIANGQITLVPGSAWDTQVVTSNATYSTAQSGVLTAVANVASIPVGARVSGTGVGREVYVRAKNVGAGTITLSQPLVGGDGTRNLTFTRHRYMLDFSGFTKQSKFEIHNVEFLCVGEASCIMLAPDGNLFRMTECTFNRPKDKGLTSIGNGCSDLQIDSCHFISNEMAVLAQDRVSIAFNANANDIKISNNRCMRFAHFAVVGGATSIFVGNHFFGGDDVMAGVRRAGLILTNINVVSFITGNYIDNCFIELVNEHDDQPDFSSEFSFGGLTITGNTFFALRANASFRWIVVTPRGPGHTVNGLVVTSNVFRAASGNVDRAEAIDATYFGVDYSSFRNVIFRDNAFNNVNQVTESPVTMKYTQATASDTWVINAASYMPFGGRARNVESLVAQGAITNAANATQYVSPHTLVEQGAGGASVHVKWPTAVKGQVLATIRVDNPL